MKKTIRVLKERILNNQKELQKKCLLSKPILIMLEELTQKDLSDDKIKDWLKRHKNTLLVILNNLMIIEKNNIQKNKIDNLKNKINTHINHLQKEISFTEDIIELMNDLLDMNPNDELLKILLKGEKNIISDIEQKLDKIEKW